MPAEREEVLGSATQAAVVRIGDTVRRPAGPWTPAVHALLRHLEDVGFEGAPRALGVDEQGREILSYLPSTSVWAYAEPVIAASSCVLLRLHDDLDNFAAPVGAVWRHEIDDAVDLRIGHNDIGPQNTVFASGLPYGFIDWELAGPRPPLYDFAYAAINFTPLRPDQFCRMVGFDEPPDRGRRLRLFCDAYGLEDRSTLLDAMERFERDDLRVMVEGGRAGVSPHSRYLARGEDRFLRYDLDWLVANGGELERAIR